jgi:hypothetical protein
VGIWTIACFDPHGAQAFQDHRTFMQILRAAARRD